MTASTGKTRVRQAVGSFDDAEGLQGVVQVLTDRGVTPAELTILVGQKSLDDTFLAPVRNEPGSVLDSALTSMRPIGTTEGAGPLLVSATPFGNRLVAAAADPSGTAQPFLTRWLSARHAGYLHQQLDAGTVLLCVHVRNGEEEKQAGRALLKHSRHQVQMHDFSFPDPPLTAA